MSVIQRIRDKAAWIIFGAIALALIAFIVQDASFRRGSLFSNSTTVGKVNGESIDKKEFDAKVDLVQQMQGAQNSQRNQLTASVWNFMVEQTILHQQLDKLGIVVPGKELSDILFDPTSSPFAREFTDPQTGVFDVEKAKQAFAQLKKSRNAEQLNMIMQAYVQPAVDRALMQKYQALITQAVYIPKWMAEKTNADNSAIANISYVYVPYSTVTDSTVKVSDDEIAAYVSKHPNEFKQEEETRSISYVTFDASANGSDTAAALNLINELKPEFATTSDAKSFLGTKGTENPYYDGYVTRANMKMPNADSIMSLADGQTFGPYLDGSNFTVAKMVGRREMPDSVKVRHILIKEGEQGQLTLPDSVAKARIDSIEAAVKGGASFEALVQKYSDDPGSKATNGEYEFASTQFAGLSKEFAEVAFYGNVGDKKVVKVENGAYAGYHYIEVLSQKNKQIAYKVAYLAKPISASSETIGTASTAAMQFASASKSKAQFDEAANKANKFPSPSPDIKENDFSIMGLGENRQFVKWIFENKVGDVSDPTEIGDKYVVAIITGVNKAGTLSARAARPMVEGILKNEKKAQQILAKFTGNSLEAYAQSTGTAVQRADSLSFQSPFIPAVGSEPKVVGAAFNKDVQGKVSAAIAGNTGVFAVKGEGVSAKPSFGGADGQRTALENSMRSQIGYRALDALRKAAVIKDNRSTFY
ncbi:peptidyl-prolyl cis-trans isomerase D [Filimonas lacunae]|uniref:Periplasmic chaperone PpiD n=1 Tax=Filimonas lacunae TaxID=477680 RepID=A0A173MPZ4_9BACT|nr:peptidylprolyl isomerase [Filimonas lacunae]BAV09745.1 peptidyl-prolyl cis-trans isomerase [Filimonas lacunae]SIS78306.1 peptidyl-prolyl cis-trans isomerase D [Filimonas lacunae]